MKAKLLCITLLAFLSVVAPVFANSGTLTFTQASSGQITAVFSAGPCATGVSPFAPASAILNGNQFHISSSYFVLDPIPNCNPALSPPYTVSALLGTIQNGHYTAVWVYGPAQVTGAFDIVAGSLQSAVSATPALGRISLFALVAGFIAVAIVVARRPNYSLKRTAAGRLR